MAKGFGGVVTAAIIMGAAAAGLAYVMQYKKAHKELDKDLKEFDDECASNEDVLDAPSGFDDDEDEFEEEPCTKSTPNKNGDRKYVSLNASKEQFVDAAKAAWEQAKEMAEPAKATWEKAKEMAAPAVEMAKDAAKVVSEKVSDASAVAAEKVADVSAVAAEKVADVGTVAAEKFEDVKGDAINTFGEARDLAEKSFTTAKDSAYVAKEKVVNRFYEFREQQAPTPEPEPEDVEVQKPFISEEE